LDITVIGTGYVGLVTSTCFAEMGNTVTCVDTDQGRVDDLTQGKIPVYEPGLESIIKENLQAGRLSYSNSVEQAVKDSKVCFIAIDTLVNADSTRDADQVLQVAAEIGKYINDYCVIVNKSTVPVGTADKVREIISQQLHQRAETIAFDVISNPDFLKEGKAIEDFMHPDRIVVGVESDKARQIMTDLYKPFSRSYDKLMFMGIRDAELTKYAANAMLATRISLMNEMADLAERLDVDIENVRKGVGADSRIGYSYIHPGCGYGGSCLPKDINTLVSVGIDNGFNASILQAVEDRNDQQKMLLLNKLSKQFDSELKDKVIGIWGLAFKPGTDDMRQATSVVLIKSLIESGARVKAYDPVAMDESHKHFPESYFSEGALTLCDHQYDALKDADAMVLVTEWKPFRQPDFNAIKRLLKQPVIIDGRNQYDPDALKLDGFIYSGVGRDFN